MRALRCASMIPVFWRKVWRHWRVEYQVIRKFTSLVVQIPSIREAAVFCCRSCFLGQALISIINTSLLSPVNTIHTTVLPTLVSHSSCPSTLLQSVLFVSFRVYFLCYGSQIFCGPSVAFHSHELIASIYFYAHNARDEDYSFVSLIRMIRSRKLT